MSKTLQQVYQEHKGKVSDKWSLYLAVYERLFADFRDKPLHLLEIGIQNGGSLEIWRRYFYNAEKLVGCDINVDCRRLTYDDPRIAIVVGDANLDSTEAAILHHGLLYNLIIDDGSHRSSDIVKSFARYFPHLADGGLFIVEDLHCSYWQEFEGGLYHPYSSITFFKHLADVVSHEHWGLDKARNDLLAGFAKQYSVSFDEGILAHIHSVEFSNSVCVIRKSAPSNNLLGPRVIVGEDELVVPNHKVLNGSASVALNQSKNVCDEHGIPFEEELIQRLRDIDALNQEIVERDSQIASLSQSMAERDSQIASLNQSMAERDTQIAAYHAAVMEHENNVRQLLNSRSWQVTKPLRIGSESVKRTIVLGNKLKLSNFIKLVALLKPHLTSMYKNPRMISSKVYHFRSAWNVGGFKEVLRRLGQSHTLKTGFTSNFVDPDIESFMQGVTNSTSLRAPIIPDTKPKLAIIIPVYRGAEQTGRCIQSVIGSRNLSSYRLIIINDASPEAEVDELLSALQDTHPSIEILRNRENLGFVKTVNRGMRLASDADVILLNSDTVVANNWVDRIVSQAYAKDATGTVTPFSNNATICSYPDLDGWPTLPNGENVSQLDEAFASANYRQSTEIPTAVGFCMYIKRSCIDDVGLFDEDSFGTGYGEENDFCLRASKKGWQHVLAADVFVFHEGEVSFSASAASKKAHAISVIRKRYPDYENIITTHILKNSTYLYRVAATAARYRLSDKPVVLFVSHTYGGGTEKHIQELAQAASANNVRVLYLRPLAGVDGLDIILEAHSESDRLKLKLASHNTGLLAAVLTAFGITKVHIHHLIGFRFSVESLITLMRVRYDVTIHDFYTICPRINLIVPNQGHCKSPTVADCNNCLSKAPQVGGAVEITWWRAKFGSLLNGADNIYCPSQDTASRVLMHFPSAPVAVVPHEDIKPSAARHPKLERSMRRVVILGVLAEHKGLSLVEETLGVIQRENFPLEVVLIGYPERVLRASKHFSQTGPYKDDELQVLINDFDPDAILFPSQCPETYSYTLSAAIRSGRPILVSNLGALPERVAGLGNCHIFPHDLSGSELAKYLLSVRLAFTSQAENRSEVA